MAVQMPPGRYTIEQLAELAKAVAIIEKAFPQFDVRLEAANSRHEIITSLPPPATQPASIRDQVIAATTGKPASVLEILMATTGLDDKKIRGVVSAPDLEFAKEKDGSTVRYKYIGPKERAR